MCREGTTMLDGVVRYFDLQRADGDCKARARSRCFRQDANRRADGEARGGPAAIRGGDVRGLGRPAAPQLYRDEKLRTRSLGHRRRDRLRPADGDCDLAGGLQKRLRSRQANSDPTLARCSRPNSAGNPCPGWRHGGRRLTKNLFDPSVSSGTLGMAPSRAPDTSASASAAGSMRRGAACSIRRA